MTPAENRVWAPSRWWRWAGFALLAVVVFRVGPESLLEAVADADPIWLLVAFLLGIPQLGLKALRWWVLVRGLGLRFEYRSAFLSYLSALLFGFVTPGRVGEVAKAFALRGRTGTSLARSMASVVLDRAFDLCLLVALGVAGLARFAIDGPLAPGRLLLVGLVCLVPWLALDPRLARGLGRVAARIRGSGTLGDRLREGVGEFAAGLADTGIGPKAAAAVLTVAAYALVCVQIHCCARALGFALPALDLVLIVAWTNLVGLLPVSMGNLGTREAVLVALFTRVLEPARPAALAVSWGLSQALVLYVGGGLIGLACWLASPPDLRRALAGARRGTLPGGGVGAD